MTVFVFGSLAAMAIAVAWALYGDKLSTALAGTGKRRKPTAAELLRENTDLKRQLAEAKKPTACPHCHLVPSVGIPSLAEIADSDRTDPAPNFDEPAPMDVGSRERPAVFAETARDTTLTAMARPGEEGMLAGLRATTKPKPAADTEAVTQTLPAVSAVVPLHEAPLPKLTWGTKPADATVVPSDASDSAREKVHATVTAEAS